MMTLVLLPGMDGTGTLFEPFAQVLAEQCISQFTVKIVRYPPTQPMDYTELEAYVRKQLPIADPYVILGESFSGPIAIALAANSSSQLKGLILCCSFAKNPYPYLPGVKGLIERLPISKIPKSVLSYFLLGPFATDALRLALFQAVAQVSPIVFRARCRAVFTVDLSETVSAITTPILYLRASLDRVVPHSSSHYISLLNSRVQPVEIEAPHLLLQTVPEEAAQLIGNFVNRIISSYAPSSSRSH